MYQEIHITAGNQIYILYTNVQNTITSSLSAQLYLIPFASESLL